MRGLFIATGSINDPKTSQYHLEFIVDNREYAEFISELLNKYQLNSKVIKREKNYMVYIKEAEKKIGSLQTEIAALKGDKVSLQESIDSLNKDKISMQESIKQLKEQVEEKDLAVSHEKELREAAESKVDDLMKEVKMSLVESLTTLREKAGKPAIEKLEERSIDSLRDSIADIKAELKESEKETKNEDLKESKAKEKAPQLNESEETIKKTEKEDTVFEDFDL